MRSLTPNTLRVRVGPADAACPLALHPHVARHLPITRKQGSWLGSFTGKPQPEEFAWRCVEAYYLGPYLSVSSPYLSPYFYVREVRRGHWGARPCLHDKLSHSTVIIHRPRLPSQHATYSLFLLPPHPLSRTISLPH